MTKTKRSSLHRVLTLFVIILTVSALLLSLSSCGNAKQQYFKDVKQTNEEFAGEVLSGSPTNKIYFIAASRGHDMTAEDFVDSPEIKEITPSIVALAKKLLDETVESSNFKSDADKAVIQNLSDALGQSITVEKVANDDGTESDVTVFASEELQTGAAEMIKAIAKGAATTYNTTPNPNLFDYILIAIGFILGVITSLVGNYYVIAIMILALIVELLMIPVSIKQQKNSIGMAKLRPKMMKIEKKYAGRTDQATLMKKQQEIMDLQENEGYSATSGCLPLIIQLVIVGFIIYPIVTNPLQYVSNTSAEFSQALMTFATAPQAVGGLAINLNNANVIELLSKLDSTNIEGIKTCALIANGDACFDVFTKINVPNFTALGLNLGLTPTISFDWLVLIPLANVAVQLVTTSLTKKWNATGLATTQDEQAQSSTKIMEFIAPLMTLFIMFGVPAIIGVYWCFRSLVSLLKQFILQSVMPVPKYTAEELREMEKMEKEKQKAQKAALKEQPKHRSRHYIDADDYDELPSYTPSDDNEEELHSRRKKTGGIETSPEKD